jgi:hypothetical protein
VEAQQQPQSPYTEEYLHGYSRIASVHAHHGDQTRIAESDYST